MPTIIKENLPRHIAIIPDGNRRWAKARGVNQWLGHKEGAKALEKILQTADELGLFCFSFWAASIDNILKRSKIEVNFLLELFRVNFVGLLKQKRLHKGGIKVNIFGRWREYFPARVKKPMEKIIAETKGYGGRYLNFMIMYDGLSEMVDAITGIVERSKNEPGLKITSELIKSNLYTKDLPPVDLVIRTGVEGDPHNSAGFMIWDTAYSQLYFTKTLWPDFGEKEFLEAIESYTKRERRMGT